MNISIGFMSWATILEGGNRGTLELSIFVLFQVHAFSVFLWFVYFMVTFEPMWRKVLPDNTVLTIKELEWTNYKLMFNIEVSKVGILFLWYYVHRIFLESFFVITPITAVIITYSILLIPLSVIWTFVWVHLIRGERLRLKRVRKDLVRPKVFSRIETGTHNKKN